MNRAAGSTRAAPPAPLIVASDAPATMQSNTPASAAETPEVALVAFCESQDKEVCINKSPAIMLHRRATVFPWFEVTEHALFLRTSTRAPARSPSAWPLRGVCILQSKSHRHHSPFSSATAGLCRSYSRSLLILARRHFSCRIRLSTQRLASTSATISKTCATARI